MHSRPLADSWDVIVALASSKPFHVASHIDPSVRGDKRFRNFNSDLAVVTNRTGMKWQERVLQDILRNRLSGGIGCTDQTRLIVVNGLDQIVDEVLGKIGAPNREIVDANSRVVLVERCICSSGNLRET